MASLGPTNQRTATVNPTRYSLVMMMVVLEDTWRGPFVIRVIECDALNVITGHFTQLVLGCFCFNHPT